MRRRVADGVRHVVGRRLSRALGLPPLLPRRVTIDGRVGEAVGGRRRAHRVGRARRERRAQRAPRPAPHGVRVALPVAPHPSSAGHGRHDRARHRKLDRSGVDDADDVGGTGRLQHAEEGPGDAVLSVELHHLLDVVRALEQLDARVERPACGVDEDLDAINELFAAVRADRAALAGHGRREALLRRLVDIVVGDDVRVDGKLEGADVLDGDRAVALRCLDDGAEGAQPAIFDVHTHFHRRVVGPLPKLNVGVERAALGAEDDLHRHCGLAVRPGLEGVALEGLHGIRVTLVARRRDPVSRLDAAFHEARLGVANAQAADGAGRGLRFAHLIEQVRLANQVAQMHCWRRQPQSRSDGRRKPQNRRLHGRGCHEHGHKHGNSFQPRESSRDFAQNLF